MDEHCGQENHPCLNSVRIDMKIFWLWQKHLETHTQHKAMAEDGGALQEEKNFL